MLLGGDEIDRTQLGNNNSWCQDNEVSWYDWTENPDRNQLHDFTRRLIRLRHHHPVFRRSTFLRGEEGGGSGLPDVWWFRAEGRKMTQRDWNSGEPVLGMFLNGREIPTPGPRGEVIVDDTFMVLFNAHSEDREFLLPRRRFGTQWALELSTADPDAQAGSVAVRRPDRGQRHFPIDPDPQAGRLSASNRRAETGIQLRATYRLQLTSQFGFASAGRWSPTYVTWASRTCTCHLRSRPVPARGTATT